MRPCYLIIQSKNKQSIKKFSLFLTKILTIEFNAIVKLFRKKNRKKILTILKSPHVNKSAQEQFEFRTYSRKYLIFSPQQFKCLLFLKKSQKDLFADVGLKFVWTRNSIVSKSIKTQLFNLNHYSITKPTERTQNINPSEFRKLSIHNSKFNILEKIAQFLKVLDIYGELNLNKHKI